MSALIDSKPRWERRKDARPQELLAAALELFVERGFAATRLEDVARRAGVSKGTLYLYFANKEELFKAMVRETVIPAIGEAEANLASSAASSAVLLRETMLGWWERYGVTRLAGVTKLMMAESNNFPELAAFYHEEVISRANALFAAILERGMARGEFRAVDTYTMTMVLTAPMVMLIMWTHSPMPCARPPLDPIAYLDAFIDMAVRGLLPDSPSISLS